MEKLICDVCGAEKNGDVAYSRMIQVIGQQPWCEIVGLDFCPACHGVLLRNQGELVRLVARLRKSTDSS